jgi:acetolactate synthase-1/2/3 large subunit
MIKLSDYVIRYIANLGVRDVFMVTGGGAMHLNDSVGQCPGLNFVCNLHEQASAMAAETYGKLTGLGAAVVTTGPGGTNAVTGVAGAYLDSTPTIFVSGQVKRADLKARSGVRQLGVQEVDIVAIVSPITKYAVTVTDPMAIRYHLEKASYLARTGRPGPVWIDIPLDVQGATIDEDSLRPFDPYELTGVDSAASRPGLTSVVAETIRSLRGASRPILLFGNGVRLAGAQHEIAELIERLGIPVLKTWLSHDMIPDAHPLCVGRPGPVAPRGANFALQNADWMLSIGARLDLVVTGYAPDKFARSAHKIMIDADAAELERMRPHVAIAAQYDARDFLCEMLKQLSGTAPSARPEWLERCREWKRRYPVVLPEYRALADRVSTYVFAEALSAESEEGDVIVSGSSGAGIEIFLLAHEAKARQRILLTTALGAMGYGLPAAIGACLAADQRRTILVDGDGGIQLNIQELETVARLGLPIKMFVLNNDGYASIRTSQTRYFGRLCGADSKSGVTLPDIRRVADAYGVSTARIENHEGLRDRIREVLEADGPVVCEIMSPPEEPRAPSLASARRPDGSMVSKPLEDLWPFLDREEFRANMIVPPLDE